MNETQVKPIVVGVDGSGSAKAALAWAARQAQLTGAPLQVVASWSWPTNYGYAMAFASDYDPEKDAKQVLDEMTQPIREQYPDISMEAHAVRGEAREVLVHRSKDASLLVVGSRGHGDLAGMLLGSVSSYCVTHSDCPTLVIRH